ncbi:MAG: hypothetical protein AAF959_20965 [Cyanobacteria bacterium P01_D01_bin.56]
MATVEYQVVDWGQLCKRLFFWLSAELILTVMGVDDLIDYIEYLRTRQQLVILAQPVYVDSPERAKPSLKPMVAPYLEPSAVVPLAG